MVGRIESRIGAERVALRIRWALLAASALLALHQLANPILLGVLAYFVGTNLWASRALKGVTPAHADRLHRFQIVRYVDGVVVIGANFLPGLSNSTLWALSIPLLVAHGLVHRSARHIAPLTGVMVAAHVAGTLLTNGNLMDSWPALAATAGGGLAAGVLAWFQTRDEWLAARDERLKTVLACGSGLGTNANLRETLLSTLRSAILETRANCGYVMLFPDETRDTLVTEIAYAEDGNFDFPESLKVGSGLSGYVAQTGQPIALSIRDDGPQAFDGMTAGVRAAISLPLSTRGFGTAGQSTAEQVLGVMTLLDVHHDDAFPSEDMDLLQALSSLLAVAVSNARMEERRRSTFLRTLESLATALEARDEYTRGHSQRVCELSLMIGEKMGLGIEALEELRVGTILHDIGKIGVPDAILNKRARLTDDEFMVMRQHPVIGYEICKPLMLSEGVLMIIRNHHEKLDGTGYPDGLKGGELPLSLRIVCVADAFDAMSSRRPYRGVMDPMNVQAELSKGAGTQFDPVVVEALRDLLPTERMHALYRSFWEPADEAEAA